MTEEELIAIVASIARHLTSEDRVLAAQFVGVLATHSETIQLATEDRTRRDTEREWEELQLSGSELSRRQREPA
ncbi:MAG TPA: hypothetical protein VK540_26780 [Polyangiaceae bacterium]|nr:hypothetical protein [Polyangiaceae bacterium]